MSRLPIRVVKLGGSLFDLVDLPERLHSWLAAQPPAHQILVIGGGPFVEEVRRVHVTRPMDVTTAHWMCIDLMTVTAHLMQDWLTNIPLIEDDRLLCQRLGERGCTIFGPVSWLRHSEPYLPGKKLPASWHVTGDSIAARLAIVLHADEFVLLKSALPSQQADISHLAKMGLVDSWLPELRDELPTTTIVNFRDLPHRTVNVQLFK